MTDPDTPPAPPLSPAEAERAQRHRSLLVWLTVVLVTVPLLAIAWVFLR